MIKFDHKEIQTMRQKLGSIYACIAGDHRYGTIVEALASENGTISVQRRENMAVGGMDGPGGAEPYQVVSQKSLGSPSPAVLVRTIKALFDSTVTRYGTPSKNWRWCTGEVGLSVDKAARALAKSAVPV